MKYSWGTERRFNGYADYFRKIFGERVQKLTVNAGFTCPNRDGTVGRGGCTFCDNRAFNPSYNDPCKSVKQQLDEGIEFHRSRYRNVRKYLAYFQAYSNTYATLEHLKQVYQPALEHDDVIGVVIGTRPDCIDDTKLDYFEQLARETYLAIEYGIESVRNETLRAVNRGHTFEQTQEAIINTAARGIRTGGHMIIGLPGEDRSDWLKAAELLSALPLHSVKFHQLQIIRGTAMEKDYRKNPERYKLPGMEEYLSQMVEVIERLNPAIILERIAGEVVPGTAATEGWGVRYDQVLQRFEKILEERDTWQGKLYEPKNEQHVS